MRYRRNAADGETGLFAHECDICFGEFVANNRRYFFLIDTVGTVGDEENRLACAGVFEDDAFCNLRYIAAQKRSGFRCGVTGLFVFDDDGCASERNEHILHFLRR